MSLVNDMLRDLDQRRKESDSPRGRVALTPASDYPDLQKSRLPYYVVFGLILVLAGLGYLWMQLDEGSAPRSLDIRSELAVDASNDPDPVLVTAADQTSVEEIEVPQLQEAQIQQTQVQQPQISEIQEQESVQRVRDAIVAEIITTNQGINLEELAQAVAALSNAEPAQTDTEPAELAAPVEPAVAEVTPMVPAQSRVVPAGSRNGIQRTEIVSLSAGEYALESIKNAADLSPQQQDVLAVQEALRIIATNQPDAAYAVLGEYIATNRYAHQSRETYAKLLLSQGAYRQAADLVEVGLQLAPNHAGFKKIKARLLVSNGDTGAAVTLLLRRAPDVSKDLEYHEILATAQLASRDYEGAAVSYTSLLREDRNQGKYWYGFAASQDFLGKMRAARQAYTEAVRQPSLSANLRLRSEQRLSSLGR